MTPLLEQQLLSQAKEGDYAAFERLQASLEPPIRRFVRRLIGSHDAEDDIVQDVFIALYYNLCRIQPPENLRPYVFKIARNSCYDELNAQGRMKTVSIDDESASIWLSFTSGDNVSQPEEVAHWLLLHLEVTEAIDRLPELQRQTLILYAEEQLSYAEIAVAMDTNIGTVKSRLHHAKKTLRRLLKPETRQALDAQFEPGGKDVN